MADHADVVKREFGRQAPDFAGPATSSTTVASPTGSATTCRSPEQTVLDVCGGAGHLSRRLAGRARQFVVLDLTREMLDTGRRAPSARASRNVLFVEGDAAAMPFVDGSFDVAVSRFAFHHLPDAEPVAREMARVVRPGGCVAVIDMVDGGARHNELERLRDARTPPRSPRSELIGAARALGRPIESRDERRQVMPAEPWLERGLPQPDVGRGGAVGADGGGRPAARPPASKRTADESGVLQVAQRWALLAGRTD